MNIMLFEKNGIFEKVKIYKKKIKIEKNVQITSSKQINRKNATKNVYELQKRMKNTGK